MIISFVPTSFKSQTFSLLPVFRPVLSKQGENSVALINVAINFGYEYYSVVIYFSNIFFIKTFFRNFFFHNFFSTCFFQNFFFQNFIKIFFLKFCFQNLFFDDFTLDALAFTKTKRTLCICVMKNMIYRPI